MDYFACSWERTRKALRSCASREIMVPSCGWIWKGPSRPRFPHTAGAELRFTHQSSGLRIRIRGFDGVPPPPAISKVLITVPPRHTPNPSAHLHGKCWAKLPPSVTWNAVEAPLLASLPPFSSSHCPFSTGSQRDLLKTLKSGQNHFLA